jgi:hypothetical protein
VVAVAVACRQHRQRYEKEVSHQRASCSRRRTNKKPATKRSSGHESSPRGAIEQPLAPDGVFAAGAEQVALHAPSTAQAIPSGQRTTRHGSSLQPPPQQTWPLPQVTPRHMLVTQVPTPPAMAHTWPAAQLTPAQGSLWHRPFTQRSPFMQTGHNGTQVPFAQYCVVSHSTLAHASATQLPGLPTHSWPAGQPDV